jgi:hypothetical protein
MDIVDIILGIAALLLWVLVAFPVGVIVGMVIHFGNGDTDDLPCPCQS